MIHSELTVLLYIELVYDSAMTKLMYAYYIIIADRSLEHQLTRETDNTIEL